jgi:hypothetical protein
MRMIIMCMLVPVRLFPLQMLQWLRSQPTICRGEGTFPAVSRTSLKLQDCAVDLLALALRSLANVASERLAAASGWLASELA